MNNITPIKPIKQSDPFHKACLELLKLGVAELSTREGHRPDSVKVPWEIVVEIIDGHKEFMDTREEMLSLMAQADAFLAEQGIK